MKIIRPIRGLAWVNDGSQLLVVNEAGGAAHLLRGVEVALWRWLHQSLSWPEIQALFSALDNLPPEEGAGQIAEILRGWAKDGMVEVCDG
jgi:hypothetical protein